jgi:hypothetical protein
MPVLKGELLFAHPFPLLAKRSLHISDYFIRAKTETISSMSLVNASDLSDARFHRNAKLGRMFRARLINPLKVAAGGLRRMREG